MFCTLVVVLKILHLMYVPKTPLTSLTMVLILCPLVLCFFLLLDNVPIKLVTLPFNGFIVSCDTPTIVSLDLTLQYKIIHFF